MSDSRKFLVIDDSTADGVLLRALLSRIWPGNVDLTHCKDAATGLAALSREEFDCVFLDYKLGDESGLDVLRVIRDSGDDIPVIMMSGCGSEQVAVQALHLGSQDYLTKDADGGCLTTESLRSVTTNAINKVDIERQIHAQEVELHRKLSELGALLENERGVEPKGPLTVSENACCLRCERLTRSLPELQSLVNDMLTASSEVLAADNGRSLDDFQRARINRVVIAGNQVESELASLATAQPADDAIASC